MKETTLMLFGTAVFSLVSDKFNPRLVFAFKYVLLEIYAAIVNSKWQVS